MLQQTQVSTVSPYFERFVELWPDFRSLAMAPEEQVLKAWEGLGYYSRARNLRRAAEIVCSRHGGFLPDDEAALLALPGIGAYTAGAILSIAFGQSIAAVDGNVVRVYARLHRQSWRISDPAARRVVRALVAADLPADRPGDFNEALMDLGATVCRPRCPDCAHCPLSTICQAARHGDAEQYPARAPAYQPPVEERRLIVLCLGDRCHVRRRSAVGLLASLYEFDWLDEAAAGASDTGAGVPIPTAMTISAGLPDSDEKSGCPSAGWPVDRQPGMLPVSRPDGGQPDVTQIDLGEHRHRFSHRIWQIRGTLLRLPAGAPEQTETWLRRLQPATTPDPGRWVDADELAALPFPTALAGYRLLVRRFLEDGMLNGARLRSATDPAPTRRTDDP